MQFMTQKALLVSIEMEAIVDQQTLQHTTAAAAHVLAIEAPPDGPVNASVNAPVNGEHAAVKAHDMAVYRDDTAADPMVNDAVNDGVKNESPLLPPLTKTPSAAPSVAASEKNKASWAQYSWLARFQSKKITTTPGTHYGLHGGDDGCEDKCMYI